MFIAQVKSFSLIELLVVIAIVAILSAVASPLYKDYKTKATIGKYFKLANEVLVNKQKEYYDKNGGFPTPVALVGTNAGMPGCSGCVQPSLLGADAANDLEVVYVGVGLWPASSGCQDNASVNIRFSGSAVTGGQYDIYIYTIAINDTFEQVCVARTAELADLAFACQGTWQDVMDFNAQIPNC